MNALLMRRRALGGEKGPKPNEIWYWADEQITLGTQTQVISHTFENGKGTILLNSNITTLLNWLQGKPITKIECVWENITNINDFAFIACWDLEQELYFPNLLTIGNSAFARTNILGFEAPKLTTVRTGGGDIGLFRECAKLRYFRCPNLGDGPVPGFLSDYELKEAYSFKRIKILPNYCHQKNGILRYEYEDLTEIRDFVWFGCPTDTIIIINNPTPPTAYNNAFAYCNAKAIYVPDESVEAYKTKGGGWNNVVNRIKPMSELPE